MYSCSVLVDAIIIFLVRFLFILELICWFVYVVLCFHFVTLFLITTLSLLLWLFLAKVARTHLIYRDCFNLIFEALCDVCCDFDAGVREG